MIVTDETKKGTLRAAGKKLGEVLHELSKAALPGVSTLELDALAERLIRERGAEPLFLNYHPRGAAKPFPATLCVSVNEEVVHGIPKGEKRIAEGDVVSLDLGLFFEGCSVDAARTLIVGEGLPAQAGNADALRLVTGTREALLAAVTAARPGAHVGDIGAAVSAVARTHGLTVVRDLGGHGTGRKEFHEAPFIANFGEPGEGEKLIPGMVLALEPILSLGRGAIKLAPDQWTYITKDESVAAHFEDTILIGEKEAEVLTA